MSKTMKKVSELEGAELDLWVARAEGKCYTVNPKEWGNACINELGRLSIAKTSWDSARYFEPSKNWGHGGPIVKREKVMIRCGTLAGVFGLLGSLAQWVARIDNDRHGLTPVYGYGETPLIAAMRCYVVSVYGEYVDA